jgi:predicted lipid-binding transport protein (Tim44 family)
MKAPFTALLTGLLAVLLLAQPAEAARLGGARSFGVQRAMPPSPQRIAPQAAPQTAPRATPQAAQPAPAGNRWLGPLAGLAAGLGLGWLLSQGGFGGMMATVLMGMLAVMVVFALIRLFMRPRAQPMQYAAAGGEPAVSAPPVMAPAMAETRAEPPAESALSTQPATIPSDFDSAGFLRQAKLNFIRLQEANDSGDLNALREVTTDSMYNALLADLRPHRPAQHTDVVNLNANLLEVATEGDNHWASVRFYGTIREDEAGAGSAFEEVWHLQKPVSGRSGWLLAGIQQVS